MTNSLKVAKQQSTVYRFHPDGYYLSFNNSFREADPISRRILVALVKVHSENDVVYYKRRQFLSKRRNNPPLATTHHGVGYIISKGLQISYVDDFVKGGICFISMKQKKLGKPDLVGIQTVLSFTNEHEPAATRIHWSYQGEKPDVRALIKQCGMFDQDHPNMDQEMIRWLHEGYDKYAHVLRGA